MYYKNTFYLSEVWTKEPQLPIILVEDVMTDIFSYLDYRKFLADRFAELRGTTTSFSYRYFSKKAGFASSNYVMLVIQGKRNLSSDAILKISTALKLKRSEAEFFENLVRFNQAKGADEKNFYYSKIAANKRYGAARPIEKEQYRYYSKWYIPAIRELTLVKGFSDDPEWIANAIRPKIKTAEAKAALDLLFELKLIERDGTGKIKQGDRHITSGDEVTDLAIANFQREMMALASASIDSVPTAEREIGSITFAASNSKLADAKRMIREFRSQLAGFLATDEDATTVVQFNIQLFPLTDTTTEEE